MMSALRLRASLGVLCLCVASAAVAQEAAAPEPNASAAAAVETETAGVTPEAMEAGRQLYLKNCRTCHGSKGTAGVPLANNPKVQGDYGYLVWAIITGPGYMPELGPALSDEQIAGITTYIMNSWGNDLGPITPENIRDLR